MRHARLLALWIAYLIMTGYGGGYGDHQEAADAAANAADTRHTMF